MLKGFLHISEIIIMILLIFVMLFQFMTIPKMRMEWERPKLTLMTQDFIHVMDMSGIRWLDADDVEARFSEALPSTMGYILTTTQEVRPVMRVGCVCNDTEFRVVSQEILTGFDLNGLRRSFSLERIDPENLQFSLEKDVIIFWGNPGIADTSTDDVNMRRYLSTGRGIVEFSDLDESVTGTQWHKDVFNLIWVDPLESSFVPSPNARFIPATPPSMGYKVQKLFYHTPFELVPEPSMAGCFRFNRGSGSIALDTSLNSNNGDLLDYDPGNADGLQPPEWVDGRYGKALLFDGLDDYVEIPYGSGLQFSDGMTAEAWVFSHDVLGDTERMEFVGRMSSFTLRNDERDLAQIGAPGPIFHVSLSDGQNHGVGYLGNPPPAANGWHHYVGVFDSSSRGIELWVDGALVGQNTSFAGLTIVDNTNPITVGGHVSGVNFFDGMIDEVILYDRALSPAEIQQHYSRRMDDPTNFVNFVSESVFPIDNVTDKIILEQESRYVGGAYAGRSVPLAAISWDIEGNGRTAWMSGGQLTAPRKQLLRSLIMWAANKNEYQISTEGDLKESVMASLIKVLNTDMYETIMVELTLGFFF